ncbi:MAG TPA: tetratricopeptide repeat protein, partial [Polyangiaceae bacterium]|nr:tetratricopeptide repeat protein [Polyangiaceae bacterium]
CKAKEHFESALRFLCHEPILMNGVPAAQSSNALAHRLMKLAFGDTWDDRRTPNSQDVETYTAACVDDKKLSESLNLLGTNLAAAIGALAESHLSAGRFQQGEVESRKSLALLEACWGLEHPFLQAELMRLARLLAANDRALEAKQTNLRALQIAKCVFGPEHIFTGRALNNTALLLAELQEWSEAQAFLERALEIAGDGADWRELLAATMNNLALVLFGAAKTREPSAESAALLARAADLHQQSLPLVRALHGDTSKELAYFLNNRGQTFSELGRLHEAAESMRQGLTILATLRRRHRLEDPKTRTGINNYGRVLEALGLTRDEIVQRFKDCGYVMRTAPGDNCPCESGKSFGECHGAIVSD